MCSSDLLPASRKPELKPFTVMFVSCAGMQGVANSDWIAEWLPWVTVSEEREWLVGEWMRDEWRRGRDAWYRQRGGGRRIERKGGS